MDHAGITGETRLSPRVSASLRLGESTRLRGAAGRYTQSPGYEKLAQSDYVLDLTDDAVRGLRSEQLVQVSASVEQDLGRGVTLRVEGYRKGFTDLLVGRLEGEGERRARVGQYDFQAAVASSVPADPIITTIPGNDGAGRAYGFDLFLARTHERAGRRPVDWLGELYLG